MRNMKKYILVTLPVLALFLTTHALAFTAAAPASETQASSTQPQYITPGGGGSAAEAGRSTSSTQLVTAAINVSAAGYYMGVCARPKCHGCWACPYVGLASAAASLLGAAAGQSGGAGMQMSAFDPNFAPATGGTGGGTDPWGNPIGTGNSTGTDDGGGTGPGTQGTGGMIPGTTPQTIARDVARLRNELDKAGVKMSPDGKTMITPDGRKFDLSKSGSGSESDMLAMGLTAAEAAQANAMGKQFAAKQAEKFKQMSQLAGAGGGGRGLASEVGGDAGYGGGIDPWARDQRNRNRAKPKISGLTKKLGNDTIGVSGDDIFEMVTRRYKARDQENHFLKD